MKAPQSHQIKKKPEAYSKMKASQLHQIKKKSKAYSETVMMLDCPPAPCLMKKNTIITN